MQPRGEFISFGKNVKLDNSKAGVLHRRDREPDHRRGEGRLSPDSNLGTGEAQVTLPGGSRFQTRSRSPRSTAPPRTSSGCTPTAQQLAGATPTVQGFIVKSNAGSQYGQALNVPDAPDVAGDAGKITKFNAPIDKGSGVVTARCKAKKFLWQRVVTYDDGTKETAELSQKCKRKKKNGGGGGGGGGGGK